MRDKIYILIILTFGMVITGGIFWFIQGIPEFKNITIEKNNLAEIDSLREESATTSQKTLNAGTVTPSESESKSKEEDVPEIISAYVTPQSLEFEYKIGECYSPRIIGIIQIGKTSGGAVVGWVIPHPLPQWLTIKSSGSLGENTAVSFTCILEKEEPQTLSADIKFVLVNQLGNQVSEPVTLKITGHVTK